MELPEAEDYLFGKLGAARDAADLHRVSLDYSPPGSLEDLAAVGFDTNVLKALRQDLTFADRIFVTLQGAEVALIAPGQTVIEYWNNHRIFASEEWNVFRNGFDGLVKKIESGGLARQGAGALEIIREQIESVSGDLQAEKSPEYLGKSLNLIRSLLEYASKPMVSRPRFAELAQIRQASRMPPGFADDKTKTAAFGDFYVWCDFLLGSLRVDHATRTKYMWVTADSKPDWKTGGRGHPGLIEEFRWVRDAELSIVSFDEFKDLFDPAVLRKSPLAALED